MTQSPVIVAAARTPIGRAFKGSLKDERPDAMVASVVKTALNQTPEILKEGLLDEILVGCGSPGGEQGFNIARVAAVLLGLDAVPGATVRPVFRPRAKRLTPLLQERRVSLSPRVWSLVLLMRKEKQIRYLTR